MRVSTKIIVGAAIVAASVAAATFGASAPAAASEQTVRMKAQEAAAEMSARKRSARKKRPATGLRVSKLSRRAGDPPNPYRTYYRPVPHFFPFAQDRGYF
jgi:hypothetical protein